MHCLWPHGFGCRCSAGTRVLRKKGSLDWSCCICAESFTTHHAVGARKDFSIAPKHDGREAWSDACLDLLVKKALKDGHEEEEEEEQGARWLARSEHGEGIRGSIYIPSGGVSPRMGVQEVRCSGNIKRVRCAGNIKRGLRLRHKESRMLHASRPSLDGVSSTLWPMRQCGA